jgi:hypothetical protein
MATDCIAQLTFLCHVKFPPDHRGLRHREILWAGSFAFLKQLCA